MRDLELRKTCRGCGRPSRDEECPTCYALLRALDEKARCARALAESYYEDPRALIARMKFAKN